MLEAHVAAGKGRFRGIRQSAGWDPAILTQTSAPAQPGLLADPAFVAGGSTLARLEQNLLFAVANQIEQQVVSGR